MKSYILMLLNFFISHNILISQLTITHPNGGELFEPGQEVTVTRQTL